MDFNDLDFLIYSSHKTSTQTLVNTININNFKSFHCHSLWNFTLNSYKHIISNFKNNEVVSDKTFIQGLINYKNKNNKKLKIISIIRNPKDRLISSFFQTFSSDEINYFKKKLENVTISVKTEKELCILYEKFIKPFYISNAIFIKKLK